MRIALEKVFTLERLKTDYILFSGMTVNYILFNGCVNLLQRGKVTVNGEKQNKDVCKCQLQQLLVHLLSKTTCLLLTMEVSQRFLLRRIRFSILNVN